MRVLTILLSLLVLVGCQQAPTGPQGLTDDDKLQIRAVIENYAKAHVSANPAASAAFHAEDGLSLPPGVEMQRGRAEIQKAYEDFKNQGGEITELTLTPVEISGVNDLACVVSTARLTVKRPGSTTPASFTGKEVKILKRQADGSWKFAVDIWNFDQPPPQQGESASGS